VILKILLRILFVVFSTWFALKALQVAYEDQLEFNEAILYSAVTAMVAFLVVFFESRFQRNIIREIVAIAFGLAAGLLVAALLVLIMIAFFLPSASYDKNRTPTVVPESSVQAGEKNNVVIVDTGPRELSRAFTIAFWRVQPWIPLILIACCYISITIVLQTKSDFRFLLPYIDFSQRGTQEGGILLDTSAIIDGRIADIVDTRIIAVPLVITDYVIRELQTLADSADKTKRLRGRRGLDVVSRLQKNESIRLVVRETEVPAHASVDDELVRTAKEIHGRVMTTDFNLNKVGQIEGVTIVNLNDLANAVKPVVIPGEGMRIKIIKRGQEAGQGVGYLDDGTMVVVEEAADKIEQAIAITITGSIQTSAGRMIFGKPQAEDNAR
jgi:uncharacterized protein YacL